VYDELIRRMEAESGGPDAAAPFLPVRDDFHPKRNQARQKLATLPRNRFKDLASDVFYELKRRYPEFQDDDVSARGRGDLERRRLRRGRGRGKTGVAIVDADDSPLSQAPAQEDRYEEPPAPGPVPIRNPYGTSSQPQPISQPDRTRVNPTPPPMSRLNSAASSHQRQGSRNISSSSVGTHRSRPSRDRTRGDSMEQLDSFDRSSGIGAGLGSMNPTAATSEVVVPNKSRLREEDIEVPYARDSVIEPISRGPSRAFSRNSQRAGDRDSRLSASTSASMSGFDRTRGGIDQRNGGEEVGFANANTNANANGNAQEMLSPNLTDDNREYYHRMSFSSNVTNKSKLPLNGGWDEDKEKKIEAAERDRRREWEEEVRGLKEVRRVGLGVCCRAMSVWGDRGIVLIGGCRSAQPPTLRHCAHCSTSWTLLGTRQRRPGSTASSERVRPRMRLSNGGIGTKGSKTSCGAWKMRKRNWNRRSAKEEEQEQA
jgi:hypothetical protein